MKTEDVRDFTKPSEAGNLAWCSATKIRWCYNKKDITVSRCSVAIAADSAEKRRSPVRSSERIRMVTVYRLPRWVNVIDTGRYGFLMTVQTG